MEKNIIKIICILLVFISVEGIAQQKNNEAPNVFLITLDGVRWQEVFKGIDTVLLNNKEYTDNAKLLKEKFVGNSETENRKKLMPFFWSAIVQKGQLYGNREKGSDMNLTNTMVFSYPGYNEILTGKADDEQINSNNKVYNPNVTVLERLNATNTYKGKVAAFGSWDVFPFIINDKRSGVPVNAGYMDATGNLTEIEKFLNESQRQAPVIWESVRLDVYTHHYAKEYIKKNQPKIVYIAYGETDDFAHGGLFDFYIKSLNNTDSLIADLWNYVQSNQFYKENTYFIITTDHGRGVGASKESLWTGHGSKVKDADQTWMAIMGPDVKPMGEVSKKSQVYTNQIVPIIEKVTELKAQNTIDQFILDLFIK